VSGANYTLLSDWTEPAPGTPTFQYDLNAGGWSAAVSSDNGANNTAQKLYSTAIDGNDWFAGIRSSHADAAGNGPTVSTDATSVWVKPQAPPAPTVGGPTISTLDVTINEAEVSLGLLYAIQCTTTGQFVQATGALGASAIWQTRVAWGTPKTVTGLTESTLYAFNVAAGNPGDATPTPGENSASAYGATGSGTTASSNVAPDTAISPALPAYVTATSFTIQGTATDPNGPEVTAVRVTIQRLDNSNYWNGTGWQAGSKRRARANHHQARMIRFPPSS
jgi:hypothetical protein